MITNQSTQVIRIISPDEVAKRVKYDLDAGEIELTIQNVTKSKLEKVAIVRNLTSKMLLGLNFLNALKVSIDTGSLKISFAKSSVKSGVRLVKSELIPARSQVLLKAQAFTTGLVMTRPFNFCPVISVANSISIVRYNQISVLLMNTGAKDAELPAQTQIACLENMDEPSLKPKNMSVSRIVRVADTNETIGVGNDLTEKQISDIEFIIREYKDAFSISGNIGLTNAYLHEIELLSDARPFSEPLRRRAETQIDETRRQVQKLLKEDIIEESNSLWASAYVLAKKKNGEMRLCIDFRKLNDVTKKCVYPLPNQNQWLF